MSKRQRWTEQQLADITRLYPDMSIKDLEPILDKTNSVIKAKARQLGIKKSYDYRIQMLKDNVVKRIVTSKNKTYAIPEGMKLVAEGFIKQAGVLAQDGDPWLAEFSKLIAGRILETRTTKHAFLTICKG